MTTTTILVHNETCVMAGRPVTQRQIDNSPDGEDCWDWHREEVSEENAERHEASASRYHQEIAKAIREAM